MGIHLNNRVGWAAAPDVVDKKYLLAAIKQNTALRDYLGALRVSPRWQVTLF